MVSRQPRSCKTEVAQWASGRRLTSAQRERKRAVDRVRASKRRTQVVNHVASLEFRLQELSSEMAALERRAGTSHEPQDEASRLLHGALLMQNGGRLSANEAFMCSIGDISSPLSVLATPGWMSATRQPGHDGLNTQATTQGSMNLDISTTAYASEMLLGPNIVELSRRNHGGSSDRATVTEQCADITACHEPPQRVSAASDGDCQSIFNKAVTMARALSSTTVCTDPSLNQDALIRGILFGWDIVTTKSPFCCPLWKILQLLDKRIFQLSGTITRLCTLRMIHSLLLCLVKADSFESLPPWYRPRPTQHLFPHALAADVLPWPGLRERAVLCEKLTQTNKFWTEVIYYFRFYWPYTIPDIVCLSPATGLYEFSGMYNNHVFEIRMWQMDMKFFESFPDTYDDIMPVMEIERPINLANIDKSQRSSNTIPWHVPLPLPEDLDGKVEDTEQLDHLFPLTYGCN